MCLRSLEVAASEWLGAPLKLEMSEEPARPHTLSAGERATLHSLRFAERRHDWLTGRAALKRLLREQGRDSDTSGVGFPNPRLSLTHAGGLAFAAGSEARTGGIGIDFEMLRAVNPRMADWFLGEEEQAWLAQQPAQTRSDELIRLWTVKESAFKSHPSNARLTLGDFRITSPGAYGASDVYTECGRHIRVYSQEHRGGYLSVAGV